MRFMHTRPGSRTLPMMNRSHPCFNPNLVSVSYTPFTSVKSFDGDGSSHCAFRLVFLNLERGGMGAGWAIHV
jgi:hypothetical protein